MNAETTAWARRYRTALRRFLRHGPSAGASAAKNLGEQAADLGLETLAVGATHGAGTVVLADGVKMLQVPLWRSYFAGCILLGIAPCTAMVLVWG
jgi:hypothetical protein